MEKISKIVIALACFALSAVYAASADDPAETGKKEFWLSCENTDDSVSCYIHQGTATPTNVPTGYNVEGPYVWNTLVSQFRSYTDNESLESIQLFLGSDIVFDGYDSVSKKCAEGYVAPLYIESVTFDGADSTGKKHVIKNFCSQTSFFIRNEFDVSGLGLGDTIKNVTFENARVEVSTKRPEDGFSYVSASIVVDEIGAGGIYNVKVKDSKLVVNSYGESEPGNSDYTYVGVLAGSLDYATIENDTIENVVILGNSSALPLSEESLFAGGIAGFVGTYSGVLLKNNDVAVQIQLPYEGYVYAGGLVGKIQTYESSKCTLTGNRVRAHSSITAANADSLSIIRLSAANVNRVYAGGLVGQIPTAIEKPEVLNNSVYGKISVASTILMNDEIPKNVSAVGGLIGGFGEDYDDIIITGNASIGSIEASPIQKEGKASLYVGYLAGFVSGYDSKISGNYHYGQKDASVQKPAGFYGTITNLVDGISYNDHNDGRYNNYEYNYRNSIYNGDTPLLKESAVKSLTNGGYAENESGYRFYNPVIPEKVMKSRAFSFELNSCKPSGNVYWENDSTNNGLPYLTARRSVYRVIIDASLYTDTSDWSNEVTDDLKSLKPYLNELNIKDSILKTYYLVYTDNAGKLPPAFVDAYESDIVKNGYRLKFDGNGASLSKMKVYGLADETGNVPNEYVYSVVKNIQFKVVYKRFIDGNTPPEDFNLDGVIAFSPKKIESVGVYDDATIPSRIYDEGKDFGFSHWMYVVGAEAYCQDQDGNEITGKVNFDAGVNLSVADIFGAMGENFDRCASSRELRLAYGPGDNITVYVARNENSVGLKASLYGYSGNKIELVETSSFEGSFDSYVALASQYKFDVDAGYEATGPIDVDVWYVNGSLFNDIWDCGGKRNGLLSLESCVESMKLKHLYVDSAAAYLGSSAELRDAVAANDVVRWSIKKDSSDLVSLDSLIVGLARASAGNLKNSGFILAPKPQANLLMYRIAFTLDGATGVISENEFYVDDGVQYKWGEYLNYCADRDRCQMHMFPTNVYRNDGCVVGWTSKDMKTNDSTLKFGLSEYYSPELAAEALDTGKTNLYPIWAPAAFCAEEVISEEDSVKWSGAHVQGSFSRVVFNAVGGNIRIREEFGDPAMDPRIRHLGSDKTMLLSYLEGGSRFLEFEAKDGFEAPEFMTLYYDYSRMPKPQAEGTGPVQAMAPPDVEIREVGDGDELPSDLAYSVLEGSFKMIDTTELAFVDSAVVVAGAAVRIKVSTTNFAAGRDAVLRISFMDNLGNVLDSTYKELVESPSTFILDSTFYMNPGDYVVRGELRDAFDSVATFTAQFEILSKIIAGKDAWVMTSLVPVDMDSVGHDDDQIFYWWNDSAEVGEFWHYLQFQPGEDVDAGRGFWYSSLEGRPLKYKESFKDSVYDVKWNLINAHSGWNMVANPHNWNVKMPEGLDEVWQWDIASADYAENRGFLKPFEAIWVRVDKEKTVTLKGEPYFALDTVPAGSKRRALAKARNEENWTISATLADYRGHQDSWNVLGMGEPLEGYEPPTGMGDVVTLAVKDGKKFLAKSIKAAPASSRDSADLEWDVVLSASSDRKGMLYFDGLDGIAAFGYHLYVTVDGRTSELMDGDTLRVALKAAGTTAKVRVTKEKLYLVTAVNGLRMAQAGNKLNVGFTATENLAGARMVVDVLGMDGKVVSSYAARAAAGTNTVTLDAPKSGLYMLRVRVASQQANRKILVK